MRAIPNRSGARKRAAPARGRMRTGARADARCQTRHGAVPDPARRAAGDAYGNSIPASARTSARLTSPASISCFRLTRRMASVSSPSSASVISRLEA